MDRVFLAFAAVLGATPLSAQTYTTYTNRAAFLAATSTPTVQTFNSYSTDVPVTVASPLRIGDLTITSTGTLTVDAAPFTNTSVNGTTMLVASSSPGTTEDFSFSRPVKSFGADFAGLNDVRQRSSFLVNGEEITPPLNGTGFFGFVLTNPSSLVTIIHQSNEGFRMDDLTYSVAAAPEPAAWAMMIFGFGIVGGTLRRRNRKDLPRHTSLIVA